MAIFNCYVSSPEGISPCGFCQRTFKSTHMCPVLTQSALLLINFFELGEDHRERTIPTCDICHVSADLAGLHHHLAVHILWPYYGHILPTFNGRSSGSDLMEVLYHIRPYFLGIFPYIGLKNRPNIYGIGTSI